MGHAPWSKAILHASHSDQRDICFGHRSILFTYFFNCVHYDTYIYPDLRTVAFDLEIDVAFPSGSQIMHRYSVWCKWYDMPHFLNLQYHFVKCCQSRIWKWNWRSVSILMNLHYLKKYVPSENLIIHWIDSF